MTGILPVLSALLVMQGAEVTASVDRTHLRVGEELMLTIRAHLSTGSRSWARAT